MPKLDAIGIVVRDLGRAREFFGLLGLEFPELTEGEDHLEAVGPGGIRLMLDAEEMIKGYDESWVEPKGQRVGLGFLCDSPAEVDEIYEKVVAAGFVGKKAPWDSFWGQRYAQVADAEGGNTVDLFAPLP
jgi:catechol 2,3-dioxygenase-like lactoylglutathione lyase family enzyme